MKTCNNCHISKQLKDFCKDAPRSDGYGRRCKECQRQMSKRHYRNNKAAYRSYSKSAKQRKQELITSMKDAPCTDCGIRYPPWCMDFDHVTGEKQFIISKARCRSLKSIKEELSKCELVCANCHRDRTQKRRAEA